MSDISYTSGDETVGGRSLRETVARVTYDYDNFQSVEVIDNGDGYKIWLDSYDDDWNRISSCWYEGSTDISGYSVQRIEMLSKPGYYADYDNKRLVEEICNEYTKKVRRSYKTSQYNFYDYDESGRKTWYYHMLNSDNRLYACNYIYDDKGNVAREVNYTIKGDWQHTLYDGSIIAISRDAEGNLLEITRTGGDGVIMHRFLFDKDQKLLYSADADGVILTYWQLTGSQSLSAMNGNNGANAGSPSVPDGVYIVKHGGNPSIIYEGTSLTVE